MSTAQEELTLETLQRELYELRKQVEDLEERLGSLGGVVWKNSGYFNLLA